MTARADPARRTLRGDRFAQLCVEVVRRLPFGLARVVAPTFLGFAVINGCTFAVDLLLLALCHQVLGLPVGVAITIGYLSAFGLSFVLNRTFNFHSHAPVGRQAALFAVVVAINYVGIILGVGAGLTALGVQYLLSRLVAGACEAVFVYCSMRWVVFAIRAEPVRAADAGSPHPDPARR